MRDKTLRLLPSLVLSGLTICFMLLTQPVKADSVEMASKYEQLLLRLQNSDYGVPLSVESSDTDNTMHGSVFGIIYHPFSDVRHALTTPESWCDIAPQHFNIKACTYQALNNHCQLTFYSGRKFYEAPDDVYQLIYQFRTVETGDSYFHTRLTSDDGPMGTRDYTIEAEAIPLDEARSFIHFSYSYHYNFFTRLGMGTYLATLGSSKVGFTLTKSNEEDEPVYIKGVRGIIERNAARYYLAIQSYLDTAHVPASERFNARIQHWFDLTEKHPRQLHEMDKDDYVKYKQMEHQDQLRLQQQLAATTNGKQECPRQ